MIEALRPEHATAMADVMRRNPGRAFRHGVFIPCSDLTDHDVLEVFEEESPMDSDLSFGAFDERGLIGFVGAIDEPGEERIKIPLLDARRGKAYSETIADLVSEVLAVAEHRGRTSLVIESMHPISSVLDLRDDDALDVLFCLGFWQEPIITAEMRRDLKGYAPSARDKERLQLLAENGITIRHAVQDDEILLDTYFEGNLTAGWPGLTFATFVREGPEFVVLALRDDQIIGYATFFSSTVFTEMPEFGPIFVEPEYRGNGISSALHAVALTQIGKLGRAKEVRLSCPPDTFAIYSHQGYEITNKYLSRVTLPIGYQI